MAPGNTSGHGQSINVVTALASEILSALSPASCTLSCVRNRAFPDKFVWPVTPVRGGNVDISDSEPSAGQPPVFCGDMLVVVASGQHIRAPQLLTKCCGRTVKTAEALWPARTPFLLQIVSPTSCGASLWDAGTK